MIEERFRENKTSSRLMYIRSNSDILPKWRYIRSSYILQNGDDIRNAYMNELYAILGQARKKEVN